jgi:hypothetical protein
MTDDKIYDILGEEIRPGCLIGYSSSNTMEVAIVSKITIETGRPGPNPRSSKRRMNIFSKSSREIWKEIPRSSLRLIKRRWRNGKELERHKGVRGKPDMARVPDGHEPFIRNNWIMLDKGTTQNRILVINNPFFHMDNEAIARQLEIVDLAKDQGLIPEDYILGKPFGLEDSEEE